MWKDTLFCSYWEQRLVVVLSVLALVLMVSVGVYRRAARSDSAEVTDADTAAIRQAFMRADSLHRQSAGRERRAAVVPVPFDPNRADSVRLSSLGLPPYVVRNILKYRARGGVFRTPESLARIYGLTAEDYARLRPYIRITLPKKEQASSVRQKNTGKAEGWWLRPSKFAERTTVELNAADTTVLQRVPGIGRVRASRIVAYRNRLGGFVHVSQLTEISGMPDSLCRWFTVGPLTEKPIHINRAEAAQLSRHPYLNYRQARAITDFRHKYGPLHSLRQLELYEEFTADDLKRLAPYVAFD